MIKLVFDEVEADIFAKLEYLNRAEASKIGLPSI